MTILLYNGKEQPYLETDMFGVGIHASLLQLRDRLQFSRNEAPDNSALWPKVFASKTLTSVETYYSNIQKEALDFIYGL